MQNVELLCHSKDYFKKLLTEPEAILFVGELKLQQKTKLVWPLSIFIHFV